MVDNGWLMADDGRMMVELMAETMVDEWLIVYKMVDAWLGLISCLIQWLTLWFSKQVRLDNGWQPPAYIMVDGWYGLIFHEGLRLIMVESQLLDEMLIDSGWNHGWSALSYNGWLMFDIMVDNKLITGWLLIHCGWLEFRGW